MNNRRSFIVGIKSTKLSIAEKNFLKKYKPWGVILFTRNIKDIKQEERSSGILMFWCVYSFLTIWERHVEWALPLMTWIPGYFYVKLLLLIIVL